jgi:hypothetical protein
MIKSIGDNYKIYGLIIVKTPKKSLVLDYRLSNATFETPNHASAHWLSLQIVVCVFFSKDVVNIVNSVLICQLGVILPSFFGGDTNKKKVENM